MLQTFSSYISVVNNSEAAVQQVTIKVCCLRASSLQHVPVAQPQVCCTGRAADRASEDGAL